jgi:hypothetical protein
LISNDETLQTRYGEAVHVVLGVVDLAGGGEHLVPALGRPQPGLLHQVGPVEERPGGESPRHAVELPVHPAALDRSRRETFDDGGTERGEGPKILEVCQPPARVVASVRWVSGADLGGELLLGLLYVHVRRFDPLP